MPNVVENPDPRYNAPKDLERAKQDRIAALEAVRDNPNADNNRKTAARFELDNIENFGYAWPANTGWPVAGPVYSQADQQ